MRRRESVLVEAVAEPRAAEPRMPIALDRAEPGWRRHRLAMSSGCAYSNSCSTHSGAGSKGGLSVTMTGVRHGSGCSLLMR